MVQLVALRSMVYGGQPYARGEVFVATPVDAAILIYRRQAQFDNGPRASTTDDPRRRYRRRDMDAES